MSKSLQVLLVEDSEDDATLLIRELSRNGYDVYFERVENAPALNEALNRKEWDIIISDYVLPEFSGLNALKILQERNQDIPCIIASGKITDETAVAAMKAGARDYVMKDNLKRMGQVVERELLEARARSQRRQAEKQLQESNEFNAIMMQNAPNPIIVINPDFTIRFINPAFEELSGFNSKEIIKIRPPYPWWKAEEQKDHRSRLLKYHGHTIRHQERHFVKKSGEDFWVDLNSIPIKDNSGKLLYTLYSLIDITEQKRLNTQMEYYIKKVTEAQEEERRRISRELHDVTAQALSIISLELDSILSRKGDVPEQIADHLKHIKENTDKTLEDIRRFSHELRPGILDHMGLIATIEQLIDENNRQGKTIIEFEVSGKEERLSPDVELAFFRIVQESLNNVRKHAQADRVLVKLDFGTKKIKLMISDNGLGFNRQKQNQAIENGHLGLIGMKERARLIGAEFKLESQPGHGTTVSVKIPR